jgi:hypothetical protein
MFVVVDNSSHPTFSLSLLPIDGCVVTHNSNNGMSYSYTLMRIQQVDSK